MKLAFLGSPEPAVVALQALVGAGHEVVVVITRADKRRGRRSDPSPTPVKELAQRLGLPVSHDPADAATSGAELGVVVAFGRIIKPDVLDRLPMVNIHFSLLPRWRGAAPVERAILAGDTRTGVCLMAVEEGLDTGGVYRRAETSIGDDESAADLTARLARIGADLLVSALAEGLDRPVAQEGEVSYAAKVTPDDLRLDWQRSAIELHRIVRVGRAWTTWRGQRLLVLAARPVTEDPLGPSAVVPGAIRGDQVCTGSGWLQLLTVQPEGRSAVPAADWLRGARPTDSDHLGS